MDPFIGEIKLLPYANGKIPVGWLPCEGQVMQIRTNQALFSLIGITYGGDGQTTFNLPDLRGRAAVGASTGTPKTVPYGLGNAGGAPQVPLTITNMPAHTHNVLASSSAGTSSSVAGAIYASVQQPSAANLYATMSNPPIAIDPSSVNPTGGSQGHNNMQPYQVMRYFIATTGVYPPRP